GAARAKARHLQRLLVGLVDIDDGAVADVRLARMAFPAPVLQELAVARPRLVPRKGDEESGIDAVLGAELEGRRVSAHHPQRRMRALHWLYRQQCAVGAMVVAKE